MCNNVIIIFLLLLFAKFGDTFRLFSSGTGTYKEARPFFIPSKNLIDDYFDGNLQQVFQTINSHTFVFVMYYASFCGISRRMREPFEKAANIYRERTHHGNITVDKYHVKFIAVDCFYHTGQCRKSYKLDYYPHMYLYVKGTKGYQYFGPTITSDIIEFIEKIRMPVIRITTMNEFLDFIVQHESNVLAQFDFSNDLQRLYYSLFAQAALRHIEYDNEHPIRFAVILNQTIVEELSTLYNSTFTKPFIILHHLNSMPQMYPNLTNNFTIDNLFQWLIERTKKPYVSWIVPKNRYYSRSPSINKATVYEALTDHDRLLVFFTSSPLDELKLREIYFHLSNCNIKYSSLWLKQLEHLYEQSMTELKEDLSTTQQNLLVSCCQYAFNRLSAIDTYNLCVLNQNTLSFDFTEPKAKICASILNNSKFQRTCYQDRCNQWLKTSSSIYQNMFNRNSDDILQKRLEKFYDQSLTQQNTFIMDSSMSMEKYDGLLCRLNTTWAFRLIDSRHYPKFGQYIGMVNSTRAVIVLEKKNEQHYILNHDDITTENIYKLVYEISENLRSRSLATIPNNNINTHGSNSFIELTADTFHSIVLNTKKHVVVVYYTKWCGFCQSIWPILFQTKKFFRNFNNLIFTRIQADKHDLPWQFTVYNYPTLVLFPSDNKSYSIPFPASTQSFSSVNVIKFLLYHLYIDQNVNEQWCPPTNNSFLLMLSSTHIDFSQLSYLVKSFS